MSHTEKQSNEQTDQYLNLSATFEYVAGTWTPIDWPLGTDGETDELFRAAGFGAPWGIEDHSQPLNVYSGMVRSEVTARWPFAVAVCLDFDSVTTVFTRAFPDLVRLLNELAPAVLMLRVDSGLGTLERYAKLKFRADHGHDLIDCCPSCNPHEHQHRRELHRRREAAKAAAASNGKGG